MSVQLFSQAILQRSPTIKQPLDLIGFVRMPSGDLAQKAYLVDDQTKVGDGINPEVHHGRVAVQCGSGQEDMLVGFFGRHDHISRQAVPFVNGVLA